MHERVAICFWNAPEAWYIVVLHRRFKEILIFSPILFLRDFLRGTKILNNSG